MSRDILFDHGNARFSYRISAIPVHEGRVLLQCPVGTNEYAFIGGHVAFGETARDTLLREIREELHADAVIGDLIAVGEVYIDWGFCPDGSPRHCHQIGLYFMTAVDVQQLPPGDTFFGWDEAGNARYHLQYQWVPLKELHSLTVYPPEVARHILSGHGDVLHFTYTELPEETRWPD
ncbi:MAG: NUDIX domain-containing protein [Clostridia bacterium]|nr:NUDIX domain-containing protein [Clostridia bacterium]